MRVPGGVSKCVCERENRVPELVCSQIHGRRWCAARRCSTVTNLFLSRVKEVEGEKEQNFTTSDIITE